MHEVVAVVVTYKRKDLLHECIECLLSQVPTPPAIIVIDNHSRDGTKESLESYIDNEIIDYYETESNIGGAGGFALGVEHAIKKGFEYIWLMDDDCMPRCDALSALLYEDQRLKGQFGFLSSKVLWKDGSLCNMNIQKKDFFHKINGSEDRSKIIMATFVSFFVRSEVVKEVGLPIKEFFIWGDDLEYSRRISKEMPCYFVPGSVVMHKSKNNIGSNIVRDNSDNLSRYSFAYRNEFYLYSKEGLNGKLYFALKILYHKIKIFLFGTNKKTKIDIINRALEAGKTFNPTICYIK